MTEKKTNAHRCLLRNACPLAGDPAACTSRCNLFVGLAGTTGTGARIAAANVPADYRNVTLEDSPARESQAAIYAKLADYAQTFERQFDEDYAVATPDKRIKSLYFHSPNTGNGKSTSAAAVLNAYLSRHYIGSLQRGITPLQRPAYYLSVNSLQQAHNRAHSPGSQETRDRYGDEVDRQMTIAKQVPFLVLDDLAVRTATPSFIGVLYDIVDYRTSNRLPSVFTSNKSIDDLYDFFAAEDPEGKVVDRIRDLCAIFEFGGVSKRGRRI